MKIERLDGTKVSAEYVRHVRTLTRSFGGNADVDVYRLADGSEVQAVSPANDSRAMPVEHDPAMGHYRGFSPGA